MKGHPGYQGDDLDRVAEIIRRVGSPRVKLLFDIYHVQIMHGDLSAASSRPKTSWATSIRPAIPAAANWTRTRRFCIRP